MKVALFWHRRDLRLHDNTGLYEALNSGLPVVPIFIFDKNILDPLEDKADRRVNFIHHQLSEIQQELEKTGKTMDVRYGYPEEVWEGLLSDYEVAAVYTNHDYEPYATERDEAVAKMLSDRGLAFHTFKDQCILEKDEVQKKQGGAYTVFSPYAKMWRKVLKEDEDLAPRPSEKCLGHILSQERRALPALADMGFSFQDYGFPGKSVSDKLLESYGEMRDIPSVQGTSRLSVHLRFGTISIREMARRGMNHSEKWLNELVWRDFYMMILHNFPHVIGQAFKPQYDYIEWRRDKEDFAAWCEGRTGYPIVDAGMRELNATGFMHNRVRMVVASFLTKHLLLDWRWGEAYFAEKLLDFELSSNNGGWQWAAGSGCDAAPYFRVFNPYSQTKKFDPELKYIKKWVAEFQGFNYPKPIVEHKFARQRALDTYKEGLERAKEEMEG